MAMSFEREFEIFLQEQKQGAEGQRLAKLQEDLTGTKVLLETVVWPVFRTFEDLMLEYEVRTRTGSHIYVDVYHKRLRIAFEEEHFVTHAEKVSRARYDFERFRVRSVAVRGMIYFPYTRDELVKKPDLCRTDLFELVGMLGNREGSGLMELPVFEREVIRCAVMETGVFRPGDVARWLNVNLKTARNVIKQMEERKLLSRVGGSANRAYAYELSDLAWRQFYRAGIH